MIQKHYNERPDHRIMIGSFVARFAMQTAVSFAAKEGNVVY